MLDLIDTVPTVVTLVPRGGGAAPPQMYLSQARLLVEMEGEMRDGGGSSGGEMEGDRRGASGSVRLKAYGVTAPFGSATGCETRRGQEAAKRFQRVKENSSHQDQSHSLPNRQPSARIISSGTGRRISQGRSHHQSSIIIKQRPSGNTGTALRLPGLAPHSSPPLPPSSGGDSQTPADEPWPARSPCGKAAVLGAAAAAAAYRLPAVCTYPAQ